MTKKYAVTYQIEYIHRVIVGIAAPDGEAAKQLARNAFDAGIIWDDTENIPLLFDDYEEVDGETVCFTAEQVSAFPEPDASVKSIRQKEFAYCACQNLLSGNVDAARNFARKALPYWL